MEALGVKCDETIHQNRKLVLRISGAGFKEVVTSLARRPVTVDSTKSRGGGGLL